MVSAPDGIMWAKLSPERKAFVMPRPRLMKKLCDGLQYKAVLVTAAPGYGKTTLLYSFVTSMGHPFVWYRLGREDVDPVTFLSHMLAGVRQLLLPDSVQSPREGGRGECAQGPDGLIKAILGCLSLLRDREAIIVLDDYDRVENAAKVNEYLDYLLEYLPPNSHIFLASRTALHIPQLARLRQYGELLELTEKDLAFTLDEVFSLFQHQVGIKLVDEIGQQLWTRTGGWPAILPLVGRRLAEGDTLADFEATVGFNEMDKVIYEYFVQHVISKHPPKVQRFIEETSILSTLTADACDAILGTSDASEMLRRLYYDHLFVSKVNARREHYLYHSLFRQFLQHRLADSHGADAVTGLHLRAAAFLEERGDWEEAIYHYAQAGSWKEAVAATKRASEQAIQERRVETVRRWIEALPAEYVDRDPTLLLSMGSILRMQDVHTDAWQILQKARDLYRSQEDKTGEARCLFELGATCYHQGRSGEGVSLLEMAWENAPFLDIPLQANILSTLAINLVEQDRLSEAIDAGERALRLLDRIPDRQERCRREVHVLRCLGWVYFKTGRVDEGIRITRRALELHEAAGIDKRTIARDLYVLMKLLSAKGELVSARGISVSVIELATKYQMPQLLESTRVMQARLAALDQDYEEAERLYRLAGYPGDQWLDVACLRLLQGRLDEAEDLYRRVVDSEAGRSQRRVSLTGTFEGILRMESGDLIAGKRLLSQAVETFEGLQLTYHLTTFQLYLARVELALGAVTEASKHLRMAMETAQANGYYNFFFWHPNTIGLLCAEALKADIVPDFVESLTKKRLKPGQIPFFLPLLNHTQIGVRKRASRIIETLHGGLEARQSSAEVILATCADEGIRHRVVVALGSGDLTANSLRRLKNVYGLTWREIDVFWGYYLSSTENVEANASRASDSAFNNRRKLLAAELSLSENTLRDHIKSIRNKLGFTDRRGSSSIRDWAMREGLHPASTLTSVTSVN